MAMNCDDFQENASRFMDGQLEASDQARLFAHLSSCSDCRSFLASSVRTREVLRKDPVRVPDGIDDQLFELLSGRQALRSDIQQRQRSFWLREVHLSYPLAAAAMLLVVLASVLFSLLFMRTSAADSTMDKILGGGPAAAGRQTVVVIYQLPEERVVGLAPANLMEVRARTVAN